MKKTKNKNKNIKIEKEKKEKEMGIIVDNVTIRYRSLKSFSVKKNLLRLKKTKRDDFVALQGITFSLERGTILGIVGSNGSGKSTLLRAIAGIFSPDEGVIDLCGGTVSLQAIGVGFKKKLTGYENIILSGLLLGFTKKEMEELVPKIMEFADIGEFMYKPVETYSSGMVSKLAFSITAILETDIILIDEILSVGDAAFKVKSYNKMKELIMNDKRTVIIVSHNMENLVEICDKVLWIEKGKMIEIGEPAEVVANYLAYINPPQEEEEKKLSTKNNK